MTRSAQSRDVKVARSVAMAGLALEAGIVLWLAGSALVAELAGRATVNVQGWAFIVYLLILLVALLLVLRGVLLAKPWPKVPAVTLQMLFLLVGSVPLVAGGRVPAGLVLGALAVVVAVAAIVGVPARTRGPWTTDPS